jgi:cell division protein FtsB
MPQETINRSGRILAVVTFLFIFAITLAPPLQRYFSQKAQINSLHAQVAENIQALQEARHELELWNDPQYVATQARSRLHYVFPGERQYAIIGLAPHDANGSTPAAPIANQFPYGLPWYGRLISSITSTNNQ